MTGLVALLLAAAGSFDARWAADLPPGAEVTVPAGQYVGPWRLAPGVRLRAAGAELAGVGDGGVTLQLLGPSAGSATRVEGLRVAAPAGGYAVRVEPGASAELRDLVVVGSPRQAAVYVDQGALVLSDSAVGGGDWGVLTEAATHLEIVRCTFEGQLRDGVALVNGAGRISATHLLGPFGEAAIAVLHSRGSELRDNTIARAGSIGIKVVTGSAHLRGDKVSGARAEKGLEGNAVYAFGAELWLTEELLEQSEGAAVSLIGSSAVFDRVTVRTSTVAGVDLSNRSALTAHGSRIEQCPTGVVVENGSHGSADGFTFKGVAQPVVVLPP